MLKAIIFILLGAAAFGSFMFYFLYEVYKEIDRD